MTDAGFLLAFLGGLLALLSPCSALLLPAFFACSFTSRTRLLRHTAAFYAGLCLPPVPLGAAEAFASRLFIGHRDTLVLVGGWTMICLGVLHLLGLGFGSRRLQQRAGAPSGSTSSTVALGAVYGLAGFCAGPILGSILTVAALGGSPLRGGSLLVVYALGMAAPLFVLALAGDRWRLGRRAWLRGRGFRLGPLHLHSTSVIGGLLFMTLGAVFLAFDGTSALPSPLDVDTEYAWEQRVTALAAAVPGHLVWAALAAAVAVGASVVMIRSSREDSRDRR
ncbi:cytochrome c biogenesis CcdA family protein [Streptomyces capillispiralis]|uniref:Cytochrome c biogenesis protein CcdA n=1 Tax=Streptomyces capillispiralis TaxID=68182 RepID=A0A561T8S0_9ACTN|nr:cytochrome c biogenesis CcdA family protein [Streptomyces capillispiralis]TWF83499.1 cytochrome c biogenesis protein CcdA [Streptomyces capillispiralis]GHH91713.1 cytochrome C biogenesis protein CcdA [Streptomyces capillispiralis]